MYHLSEQPHEIDLHIEDISPEAVMAEALLALSDVLGEGRGGQPVTHEVHLRADDFAGLLAAWVEELIRLAEDEGFLPERVAKARLEGTSIDAVVAGERSLPQSRIKAVTYDRLEMNQLEDGAWTARVILRV